MENFGFENSTRFSFGRGQLETAPEREHADASSLPSWSKHAVTIR